MSDDYFDDNDVITGSTLDAIGAGIEEGQEMWDRYAYLAVPKIPCVECGGAGSIGGGSLGGICPRCMGARVLDHPGAEAPQLPDFSSMRRALTNYSTALEKGLALPPASTLPRPEAIKRARTAIKEASKQIMPAPQISLPAPRQEPIGSLGDGSAEFSDAEIDDCIDADTE